MVNKSSIVSEAIKGIITSMMDRVMSKVLFEDPFIPENQ